MSGNANKLKNGLSHPEVRFWLVIILLVASVVGTVVTLRTRQDYIITVVDLQRVEIGHLRQEVGELQRQVTRIETMIDGRVAQR